ncbi:hypothetical protein LK09_01060 [Microbacterium mangrovi]|uniref:TQXA domain-containing protein n=1 Tax=Microbacterium mangrovi TaxID=1348253 RepID=A0A0B2ADN7_9MICO|nr:VaFE repeat-containing surface-anchored protein [Microbacterium mangrovi]KHK99942.1 hypothetical protein LK09_01060 [Microbacterium mangrovi]
MIAAAATVAAIAGSAFGGAVAASAAVGDTATLIWESPQENFYQLSDGSYAYCLDRWKKGPDVGNTYRETDWNSYTGATTRWNTDPSVRGDVLWILAHSYPSLTPAEVSAETGIPVQPASVLSAGTQHAIWYFTNGIVPEPAELATPTGRLYTWLVDHATPISPNSADGGSISLTKGPGFVSTPGQKAGPFVVTTDQVSVVSLSASAGGTIVDSAGSPLTTVLDGDRFWVTSAEPQNVTVTASGTYVHQDGHIWVDTTEPQDQELSMGAATPVERSATIDVDLAPAPPEISTTATDKADGNHGLPSTGGVVKDVVSYTGLTPGTEYTVTGVLMDKATGKSTGITASKTLTPTTADGSVEVDFTLPEGFAGDDLVVFEKVLDANVVVAAHEDITATSQTVHVDKPTPPAPTPTPTPTPTPSTYGPSVNTGGTVDNGGSTGGWMGGALAAGMIALLGAGGIRIRRKTTS